jgi:MATE family multidrug resistance protein
MLISTILIFFPAYYLFSSFMENHGLWLAFILFMGARGLTMSLVSGRAVYEKVTS